MKNPFDEMPGITIDQKNGEKVLIKVLLESAIELLDDGQRYDLKIVLNKRVKKGESL